jgi:hypothetical protein
MGQGSAFEDLLGKVFDASRDGLRDRVSPAEYQRLREDFIFHMVDWTDDLERLRELRDRPEIFDTESSSAMVAGFLYHVIPHLTAAGRLLLDEIPDPFTPEAGVPDDLPDSSAQGTLR